MPKLEWTPKSTTNLDQNFAKTWLNRFCPVPKSQEVFDCLFNMKAYSETF